ncbi:MAG: class II aldolase/adducin family protein [Rhodobacteraceae bacterium]|nr:class II aldolase/adducin family protein [Paracoccaceae bacterium]
MTTTPASGGLVSADLLADLAAASRILAARGVVDGFGHVSMRHPDTPDRYLMSRGLAPALVTPEDIVEYDLDSTACDPEAPKGFLERFIHGEIYKARPDINSVVHSHSPSVIPFGLTEVKMQAMFHNAAFLAKGVPVFDISEKFGETDMLVCDCAKGVALAEKLGDKDIALMRAHGSVACGPSLQVAVFRAVYTEVSARIQHWATALANGGPLAALSEGEGALADQPNLTAGMRAWDLWRSEIRDQTGW